MNEDEMASQIELKLVVAKAANIGGMEMGVLADGTPYLTGHGLAAGVRCSTKRDSDIGR